ncbi:hypothetical protein NDU88_007321 [Pleurodeles waltl]|uniref:Uncharacterized protein n=1 Tax=Pleurodeles waltl TaxID=8319 RepID=A0AAV7URY9_PLEWA|nr:hypothetical protein NDU88_007321 [Pleurodeles waltl]
MESGEKEQKKVQGGAADDGEEERKDGAGGQETGTLIGGSWIQDRSIPATGGIRTRKGEEETGTPCFKMKDNVQEADPALLKIPTEDTGIAEM